MNEQQAKAREEFESDLIRRAVQAAVAAERERCAKLCESMGLVAADMYGDGAECI